MHLHSVSPTLDLTVDSGFVDYVSLMSVTVTYRRHVVIKYKWFYASVNENECIEHFNGDNF